MIVHSHPSSEKHHTHTTGQVILIAHLSTIQTLEPGGQTEMTVFRPVLYVLEYKTNTFRAKVWGIERSGFFNGREKWAKGFENQRV